MHFGALHMSATVRNGSNESLEFKSGGLGVTDHVFDVLVVAAAERGARIDALWVTVAYTRAVMLDSDI